MAARRACLGHGDLTPRPGAPQLDRSPRTVVPRPRLLEVVQDVLRAVGRPHGEEVVVVVPEAAAATHGDEPGIPDLGEDHASIVSRRTTHARRPRREGVSCLPGDRATSSLPEARSRLSGTMTLDRGSMRERLRRPFLPRPISASAGDVSRCRPGRPGGSIPGGRRRVCGGQRPRDIRRSDDLYLSVRRRINMAS